MDHYEDFESWWRAIYRPSYPEHLKQYYREGWMAARRNLGNAHLEERVMDSHYLVLWPHGENGEYRGAMATNAKEAFATADVHKSAKAYELGDLAELIADGLKLEDVVAENKKLRAVAEALEEFADDTNWMDGESDCGARTLDWIGELGAPQRARDALKAWKEE